MYHLFKPDKILDYHKSFENQADLDSYQKTMLANLGVDEISKYPVLTSHPDPKLLPDIKIVPMVTSGTAENRIKKYYYSQREYDLIQRYHFRRLMHCNHIKPGNSVRFVTLGFADAEIYKTCGLKKVVLDPAMAYDNVVWYAVYSPFHVFTDSVWTSLFESICSIKPNLLYCGPCEFELFDSLNVPIPECPIVFSGETLYQHVREKASRKFTKVINKMRCWDGGLSFFECEYGRLHVNDELCYAEQIDGRIVSTDFFNYVQKFVRFDTNDKGNLLKGLCPCGIFGNYFEQFQGKFSECIITNNGKLITGQSIVNLVLTASESLNLENFRFSVVQKANKDITIRGTASLTELQIARLSNSLTTMIGSNDTLIRVDYEQTNIDPSNAKQLLVRSYAIK